MSSGGICLTAWGNKKADLAESPKELCHVGLLSNSPPERNRAAMCQVVRTDGGRSDYCRSLRIL